MVLEIMNEFNLENELQKKHNFICESANIKVYSRIMPKNKILITSNGEFIYKSKTVQHLNKSENMFFASFTYKNLWWSHATKQFNTSPPYMRTLKRSQNQKDYTYIAIYLIDITDIVNANNKKTQYQMQIQ